MKKKIVTGSIIAVIIVGFVILSIVRNTGNVSAFGGGGGIPVRTGKVLKGDISSYISANGVVEEIDKAEVYLDMSTRVEKILVEKNQRVTHGQKLVDLDLSDLKAQLEQAKINKETQELAIKKLEVSTAEKDIAKLEASVKVAENDVRNAQASYDSSKEAYDNSKELYDAGAISKNEMDNSEKAKLNSEIALKNARLNYDIAVQSLKDAETSYARSSTGTKLDLETQQKNLEGIALNIKNLEDKLSRVEELSRAPIDGVISEINITEGTMPGSMEASFKIVNPDKLRIVARVSEYNAKFVSIGQKVSITGDSIADDEKITGSVVSVAPAAVRRMVGGGEETSVEVIIGMDETGKAVKPGFNVTCDISTAEKKNVLVAELGMFEEDKDGNKFAYVIDEKDNIMHKKQVRLGINSDLDVEVAEGLKEGDVVVIDPQPTFKDGEKVKIKNDMK